MSWLRRLLILSGLVLVLGAANFTILQKQRVVDQARLVLLELAPVDPRSLMQGDYMDLAYADAATRPPEGTVLPEDGIVIVTVDAAGIATFTRLDDGTSLGANELRLRYVGVSFDGRLDYGSNAFFFQEGDAGLYASARYGMLRVDETGNSVLVGLADENRQPLGGAAASDLSNFPGCVDQGQHDLDGDILPNHMKYESIAGKETDEPDLHSEFIKRILENTHNDGEYNDLFYVTFAVYYEFNRGVYKQFASAILCRNEFGSAENNCRNRSYFLFSEIPPAEMANVLLNDISKFEPIVRRCEFPGSSQ